MEFRRDLDTGVTASENGVTMYCPFARVALKRGYLAPGDKDEAECDRSLEGLNCFKMEIEQLKGLLSKSNAELLAFVR